ncbi:MAG: outer membrane beta-barrel family protein [Mucilaginibacter sp.]
MKLNLTTLLYAFILTISFNGLALAQTKAPVVIATAKVSGSLVDAQNKPVGYATISLLRAKDSSIVKGTLSADAGTYVFDHVAAGTYVIRATAVGYTKANSKGFTVATADVAVPPLTTKENTQSLATVNITAAKPLIERKIDRMVMNVENSILAAGNSAMEILERAPGVTVDKDDNISLNGKQGVTVMINDKLTYLSAAQLANLLRSTDGNTIQSIELITNPSAKYDASGNSGIINIKLKKNNQSGTNGSLIVGGGYGNYPKDNSSLSLNHKEGNLNVFGNFSRGDNQRYQSLGIKRTVIGNGATTYFDQYSFLPRTNHYNNYRVGADYDISKKNTVGFIINGYFNSENDKTDNNNRIGSTPAAVDSSQHTVSSINQTYKNFAININDKQQIDTLGQAISFDFDYSKFNNNNEAQYYTDFFLPNGSFQHPSIALRNQTPSKITIYTAKTDYTYPITKSLKMEAGLKYSDVSTDNDLQAQKLAGGAYINDVSRTNRFIYDEKISAGYLNFSKTFKKTSVQLGLRTEHTSSTGDLITNNQVVTRDYTDLFPSLFINQTLSPKNDLGFSYSRRIDRPGYDNLNPFVFYLDQYTYVQGNPFLKPQYTNKFELNYTYNKTINVSLGYSQTKDAITQILLTDVATKATFQTNLNLQTQNNYSVNINTPYTVAKWFTGNVNFTGFYMQFKSDALLGANYNRGSLNYQTKITQNLLFGGFKAEIMENYQSKLIYGLFEVKPQYAVDAGISKAFANKKLNVKFAVSDIFNIRTNDVDNNYQTDILQIKQKNETRIARLTLTYNFGNSKIKARNHQTGSSDESNRVNSGN